MKSVLFLVFLQLGWFWGAPSRAEGCPGTGDLLVRLISLGDPSAEGLRGPAVLSGLNWTRMECPDGRWERRCTVDRIMVPADCGWECQDGLLGLQGVTALRGRFEVRFDPASQKVESVFRVEAGFDTWRKPLGLLPMFHVRQGSFTSPENGGAPAYTVRRINNRHIAEVDVLDFSKADDPNFALYPERGMDWVRAPEGLLVTGELRERTLVVDRVFRQWTPRPVCDPHALARTYVFGAPVEGEVYLEFATQVEAQSYREPEGRFVHWLVPGEDKGRTQEYWGGRNDLWAVRFEVNKVSCALTLTGEH